MKRHSNLSRLSEFDCGAYSSIKIFTFCLSGNQSSYEEHERRRKGRGRENSERDSKRIWTHEGEKGVQRNLGGGRGGEPLLSGIMKRGGGEKKLHRRTPE